MESSESAVSGEERFVQKGIERLEALDLERIELQSLLESEDAIDMKWY